MFLGRLPDRVLIALVHTDNFNGAFDRCPFAYERFGVTQVRLVLNWEDYPYRPLKLSNVAGQEDATDLLGYDRLLTAMNTEGESFLPMILSSDWGHGQTGTIFLFNNLPRDNPNESRYRNPAQMGNIRLQIEFGAATQHNITVLIWSKHENVFEINHLWGVKYNFDPRDGNRTSFYLCIGLHG